MRLYKPKLQEKLEEAFKAVLPVVGIVLLLCFSVAPVPPGILMEFLVGGLLLIVGMMFFTLGAELSMTPMGEQVGRSMTKSKKLWVMVVLGFILGFVITISEPDLQVLAVECRTGPDSCLLADLRFSRYGGDWNALLAALFSADVPKAAHNVKDLTRTLLENNLQADGSVAIPAVLRPYMGGLERMIPAN